METTRTDEQFCPYCGHLIDAHSTKDGTPSPGDISICFYCGEVMIFSKYLSLIKCTDKDYFDMDSDTLQEIKRIQKEIKSNM